MATPDCVHGVNMIPDLKIDGLCTIDENPCWNASCPLGAWKNIGDSHTSDSANSCDDDNYDKI